jgi:retinoid hydroxylase
MAGAPLPPGETDLPILGETLTLLKNGFSFVEAGARGYGPIFKTNVFGRATAVVTGPNASALFIDPSRVQRSGSMPAHIQTLFAGRSLPLLDGEEHRDRKHFVMAAFTREALASYLPTMQRLVFLVELYRAFDVVIARPQDLGLDWSRIPPEPKEGLRASVKRRQPFASCFA